MLSVMAQEDNLGDIEIRERLFDCVASTGVEMLVYRGRSTDSYVEAFSGKGNPRWYTSSLRMQTALIGRALRGQRVHFFIAPGPARFSSKPRAILKSAANLANMLVARASGGTVHIVGRAYRGEGLSRAVELAAISIATTATVRDELSSRNVGGRATTMPDLAFHGPRHTGGERRYLAISVRTADDLEDAAFAHVVQVAREFSLAPIFVTQVKRDNAWMRRMAAALQVEMLEWNRESHQEQRARVEQVYRESAVVISNRLHGLIMGAMAGAQPVPLVSQGNTKLLPTLQVVFGDIRGLLAGQMRNPNDIRQVLQDTRVSALEIKTRLDAANALLSVHFSRIADSLMS